MKTIKLKNVALFAFALAATAFVSSCSSSDADDDNNNNEKTVTFNVSISEISGDADSSSPTTRAALLKEAYSPIQEMNIDAGDGVIIKGAQIVDETLVEAATRATTEDKETMNGETIKVYCYKTDGEYISEKDAEVSGGKVTVALPSETAKVILYVGNSSVTGSFEDAKIGTVTASTLTATESFKNNAHTTGKRCMANNMVTVNNDNNSDYTGKSKNQLELACKYDARPKTGDKLYFTRLAARVRSVMRQYKGSTYTYTAGSNTFWLYITDWDMCMKNIGAPRMENVKLTSQDGQNIGGVTTVASFDGYNETSNTGTVLTRNLAYYHSAPSEDKLWYESQRGTAASASSSFYNNGGNGTNTWRGDNPDKYDVWYNVKPHSATSYTWTYYRLRFCESVYLGMNVSAATVPSITLSNCPSLKAGHSYTFYFYAYIPNTWVTKAGLYPDSYKLSSLQYDWDRLHD